jgi:hypothetical protein
MRRWPAKPPVDAYDPFEQMFRPRRPTDKLRRDFRREGQLRPRPFRRSAPRSRWPSDLLREASRTVTVPLAQLRARLAQVVSEPLFLRIPHEGFVNQDSVTGAAGRDCVCGAAGSRRLPGSCSRANVSSGSFAALRQTNNQAAPLGGARGGRAQTRVWILPPLPQGWRFRRDVLHGASASTPCRQR